jgi:hypothetical protein
MHDPEHHQFHAILVTLKAHLDAGHIAYPPAIFDGLMLDLRVEDFAPIMHGHWEEEVGPSHNFQYFVDIDAAHLRITHKLRKPDPESPDTTWTTKIKAVRVDERQRYLVSGEWSVETNTRGFKGKKIEPSDRVYSLWPVGKDVAWSDDGRPGQWMKLRRTAR